MEENIIIEVEHVNKRFGEQTVLNDVSFCIEKQKIYGIVGRNGSGKTVLFKSILGFITPDSGKITVKGKEIGKHTDMAQDVGIIIENPGFLPNYSGFRNLKYLAMIKGRIGDTEIRDAITLVGLDPDSKKWVGKYSMGMRQRLAIAQAIMENPEILILDEPMNGLDNQGVQDMRALLQKLREEGKTILIASHNPVDIELLCDTVYEMDAGVLVRKINQNTVKYGKR